MTISAVILTKNEEKNIVDCIESLSFCDEIIVVDDNSEDRTVDLAKKLKAKVFVRSLDGDFSKQRNFGLEKANGNWVLFVDADERVTVGLAGEIKKIIRLPKSLERYVTGFRIKRFDYMWSRKLQHGETGNINFLRLGRKNAGRWEEKVHETWKVKGEVSQLQHPLLHYPHQTVAKFLQEINFYTDIRAKELYEGGIKAYWWSIILYPKLKFLLNYFLRRGFLDGIPGLVVALLMSFHSFLVRGKLWLLWQKKN